MHLIGVSAIIGLACALAVQAAPALHKPAVIAPSARKEDGHGGGVGRDQGDHPGGQDGGDDRKNRDDHKGQGRDGKGRDGNHDDGVVVVIVVQKIVIVNIKGRHAQQRPQTRVHTYGRRKGGKQQRTRTQYVNRKGIKYITEKPAAASAPVDQHGSQGLQEAVEDAAAAEEAATAERNAALAAGKQAAADDAAQKAIDLKAAKEEAQKRLKEAQGGDGAAAQKAAKSKATKGAAQ